jgi:hypothetical protein
MAQSPLLRGAFLELVIRFLVTDHFAAKNVNIQCRACLTKTDQSAIEAFFLPTSLLAKDRYVHSFHFYLYILFLSLARVGVPDKRRDNGSCTFHLYLLHFLYKIHFSHVRANSN